jgi:hypothetical protein
VVSWLVEILGADKIVAALDKIADALDKIKELLRKGQRSPAVRIMLALPQVTYKGKTTMADIPLANDLVYTIGVIGVDGAGNPAPLPAGDVVSAVASDPTSLGVAIGTIGSAGAPAVVLTPLKQNATGVTVTVTDTAGLTQDVATFDIGPGVAKGLGLDFANETTTPQPVPPS